MCQNKANGRCKQAVSRASKWGDYSSRGVRSAAALHMAIYQHQARDLHRLSDSCFHSPAAHFEGSTDPRGYSMQRTVHGHDLHTAGNARCLSDRADGCWRPAARDTSEAGSRRRQPSCPSSSESLEISAAYIALGSTTDPFRGRVPQIQDWVDVWAETSETVSIWGRHYIQERHRKYISWKSFVHIGCLQISGNLISS